MQTIKILAEKKNSIVKVVRFNDDDSDTDSHYVAKYYYSQSRSMIIELNILANCHHENIIKLCQLHQLHQHVDDNLIMMIMPLENANLIDIIIDNNYNREIGLDYLRQIANGVEYLHHNQIVHFDLKSENIVVSDNKCKIIDFGCAEFQIGQKIFTPQIKCTVTHRAVEGFNPNINQVIDMFILDSSFDIWSFGIIIFEILIGMPMYIYLTDKKNINIKSDCDVYNFIISEQFHQEIKAIIPANLSSCLNVNPKNRPNISNVIINLGGQPQIFNDMPLMTSECGSFNDYYQNILKMKLEKYPHYRKYYPDIIIRSTFELIHQLGIQVTLDDIKQAILLCYQFTNNQCTFLFDDLIDDSNNISKITTKIIIAVNGRLFWPYKKID